MPRVAEQQMTAIVTCRGNVVRIIFVRRSRGNEVTW